MIKELKKRGVDEKRIHYITFEEELEKLNFEKEPKEFIKHYKTTDKKHYFLLDEVQYIENIGKKLKLLFDTIENIKLVITGSSSFDLTDIGEYLVGRIIFFDLYPFSFSEFLKSKDEKYEKLYHKIKIDLDKPKKENLKKPLFFDDLNKLLHEYLKFGSYPRVVLEKNKEDKKDLLASLFTTYVERDIVGRYGIKHREKTTKLLKSIASINGMVDYQKLGEHSGLTYRDIKDILPLLENSFVISKVKPFHKNLIRELRKNPKIYFVDYGIRNYLLNFENLNFGELYENLVYNELIKKYKIKYWRTTSKAEVDFIIDKKNPIPIEVKTKPKITRSFRSFIKSYQPKNGYIFNLNELKKEKAENCQVNILPFVFL